MKSLLFVLLVTLLFRKLRPDITIDEADDEYDFIVVGAGNTGSVVASRVSENENIRVLLLEAGGSDASEPEIHIPGKMFTLGGTPVDWNYTVAAPKQAFEKSSDQLRSIVYPRGKVLGGTSSINYMTYVRGSPHDYDSWEGDGARGWNFKSVEPFFRKLENAKSSGMSAQLGRNGPLYLTRNNVVTLPFLSAMVGAATEIGIKVVDFIDTLEGLTTHITRNVYRGLRQSSSVAYLWPNFPERKDRLHIVTGALATRILISNRSRAYGVKYIKDDKSYVVRASKEIILSAGVFGTPHLLMLSGIGPKEHLQAFNISVVKDLPGVGSNLQDHPYVANTVVAENIFLKNTDKNPELQYIEDARGELTDHNGIFLSAKSAFFNTSVSGSTSELPVPDITMIVVSPVNRILKIDFLLFVTHPKSRGTVRLRSSNPRELPLVDGNYYANEDDIKLSIAGSRLFEEFEKSRTFIDAGLKYQTPKVCKETFSQDPPRKNAFYRCMIYHASMSMNHGCCTAKIGRRNDRDAVVDWKLRVYGVKGLRIADTSVMPRITTLNPQATCYMIGEKAAEMIKQEWKLE